MLPVSKIECLSVLENALKTAFLPNGPDSKEFSLLSPSSEPIFGDESANDAYSYGVTYGVSHEPPSNSLVREPLNADRLDSTLHACNSKDMFVCMTNNDAPDPNMLLGGSRVPPLLLPRRGEHDGQDVVMWSPRPLVPLNPLQCTMNFQGMPLRLPPVVARELIPQNLQPMQGAEPALSLAQAQHILRGLKNVIDCFSARFTDLQTWSAHLEGNIGAMKNDALATFNRVADHFRVVQANAETAQQDASRIQGEVMQLKGEIVALKFQFENLANNLEQLSETYRTFSSDVNSTLYNKVETAFFKPLDSKLTAWEVGMGAIMEKRNAHWEGKLAKLDHRISTAEECNLYMTETLPPLVSQVHNHQGVLDNLDAILQAKIDALVEAKVEKILEEKIPQHFQGGISRQEFYKLFEENIDDYYVHFTKQMLRDGYLPRQPEPMEGDPGWSWVSQEELNNQTKELLGEICHRVSLLEMECPQPLASEQASPSPKEPVSTFFPTGGETAEVENDPSTSAILLKRLKMLKPSTNIPEPLLASGSGPDPTLQPPIWPTKEPVSDENRSVHIPEAPASSLPKLYSEVVAGSQNQDVSEISDPFIDFSEPMSDLKRKGLMALSKVLGKRVTVATAPAPDVSLAPVYDPAIATSSHKPPTTPSVAISSKSDQQSLREFGLAKLQEVLAKHGKSINVIEKNVCVIPGVRAPVDPAGIHWGLNSINPILANILANSTIPKFTGRDEEWYDFRKEWLRHLTILTEAMGPGQDIADALKLKILQNFLDDVPKFQLQAQLERKPDLTYAEFWKELDKTYGRDILDRHRREWERLTLRYEEELTLHRLRTFKAQFDMCLARMGSNVSEAEVGARFFNALPLKNQEEMSKEIMRRNRDRYWVRIPKPSPLSTEELKGWISTVGRPDPKVEENSQEILLDCTSDEARDVLLACHESLLAGGKLYVYQHTARMSYSEMCTWLLDRLRIVEEFRGLANDPAPRPYESWTVVGENRSGPAKEVSSSDRASSSSSLAPKAPQTRNGDGSGDRNATPPRNNYGKGGRNQKGGKKGGDGNGGRGRSPDRRNDRDRTPTPPRNSNSSGLGGGNRNRSVAPNSSNRQRDDRPREDRQAGNRRPDDRSRDDRRNDRQPGSGEGRKAIFDPFTNCGHCWNRGMSDFRHHWKECPNAPQRRQPQRDENPPSGKGSGGRGGGKGKNAPPTENNA